MLGGDRVAESEHVKQTVKLRGEGGIAEFLKLRRDFQRNQSKVEKLQRRMDEIEKGNAHLVRNVNFDSIVSSDQLRDGILEWKEQSEKASKTLRMNIMNDIEDRLQVINEQLIVKVEQRISRKEF